MVSEGLRTWSGGQYHSIRVCTGIGCCDSIHEVRIYSYMGYTGTPSNSSPLQSGVGGIG